MAPPPTPACSFASDNAHGASPEVIEAIAAANAGPALAYGEDPWTERAVDRVRELVGAPAEVLLCWGGTGANIVGLAGLLQPWEAVIAPDSAHIVVDECGGPARFTGSTIATVATERGKLHPDQLAAFDAWSGSVHHPQPKVVSISQATEWGTRYTLDELAALADVCHRRGWVLHVDGARLANAVAALGTDLVGLVRDTGVDVLTLGLTKNGAVFGEAVVHLRPELAPAARFVHKQAGQLVSKSRFVAAQLLALLEGDLWLRNARHANAMARLLHDEVATIPGVTVPEAPEVNAVFAQIPWDRLEDLQRWSFFWPWDPATSTVRWMTGFATTEADVRAFATGIRALLAEGGR